MHDINDWKSIICLNCVLTHQGQKSDTGRDVEHEGDDVELACDPGYLDLEEDSVGFGQISIFRAVESVEFPKSG